MSLATNIFVTILTSDRSYLIVGQVDVLHGKEGQLVRPVRVSSVLHVPGDGEELHGRHDVRGRVDDDLIGRFKADGGTLAQVEGVERTVGRILQTADTSISSIYTLPRLFLGVLLDGQAHFYFSIFLHPPLGLSTLEFCGSFKRTLVAHWRANVLAQLDSSSCWT
jgi:hypothetical protein